MTPFRKRVIRPPTITPLIDITFQLVIFLILTASFTDQPAISLNLPEAGTAATIERSVPSIHVSVAGSLFWNDQPLADLAALNDRLQDYAHDRAAGSRPEIRVMADKGVSYGLVVAVMDLCRTHGLIEIILGTEEKA